LKGKKEKEKEKGKRRADEPPAAQPACCDHDHGEHDHGLSCDFELGIRPYKPEDYRELKAVWKLGDIVLDETDSARVLKTNLETRRGSFQVFVAEIAAVDPQTGKPAGIKRLAGGVTITFDGHRAYIYHFAVHPDFRGVGLGTALLETCEHQAQLWGAKHLRLMSRVDAGRAGARKLYEKHGWKCEVGLCQFKKDL
jgi:ribosomal protein S18 acetylase RimI-like enzyme